MKKVLLATVMVVMVAGCGAHRVPILNPPFYPEGFQSEAQCLSACSDHQNRQTLTDGVYGAGAGAALGAGLGAILGAWNPWAGAGVGALAGGLFGAATSPPAQCQERCAGYRSNQGGSSSSRSAYQRAYDEEIERLRREKFRQEERLERSRAVNDARADFKKGSGN